MNHSLTFRNLQDENQYSPMVELNLRSRLADHNYVKITVQDIAQTLAHMDGVTPQQGVIFACLGQPLVLTFSIGACPCSTSSSDGLIR